MFGDSDRPGVRRLYFTAELDYYAEFRSDDVIAVADIPADQSPFEGEPATRITLRRDATVDYTHTRHARPLDEFDLDVRLAAQAERTAPPRHTDFCGVVTPGACTAAPLCQVAGTALETGCNTCAETCSPTCGQVRTCETCAGNTCAFRTCGCGGH